MKNYVQLWIAGQNDGGSPPTLQQYGFFFSADEATAFMNANAWNVGPNMYYFLLNKWNAAVLINQYPWSPDAYVVLPEVPQQYVTNIDEAQSWGGDNQLFQYDSVDPASIKARESADKTRDRTKAGTKLVGTETTLQALETFAGALVAAGFKTGKGTLLTQLIGYIDKLLQKQPIDQASLGVLLLEVESALK